MPPQPRDTRISVVMPVHNAVPHLDRAVESILAQTWSEYEFVIYDDGSTDGSTERLRRFAQLDRRIRLHEGQRNLGPAASSNHVVRLAQGRLIARMDADDVSHPDRLRRQLELLQESPDVGLVGTMYETIDADGATIRGPNYWRLFHRSWFVPFPHGSIMYRREIFERLGGYREECVFWEDQDFFLRASPITRIAILPAPLYQHRHSPVSTRLASDQDRVEQAVDLMYRSVERLKDGKGYDDLLCERRPRANGRVDPRVFISLGSLVLWAGGRPRYLRRLMSRGELSTNIRTLSALAWTAWASISPSTLRGFLRLVAAAKNAVAGSRRLDAGAVDWLTPRKLQPALRPDGEPEFTADRLPQAKPVRAAQDR
jgi:glycosyltransferase involved in cell wall biosynthesis